MGGYIAAVAVDLIVLLNSRFNSMGMRNLMWIEMLFLFFLENFHVIVGRMHQIFSGSINTYSLAARKKN